MLKRTLLIFCALWTFAILIACAGGKSLDIVPGVNDYSGYIVVTTLTTDPATGPGIASLFDPNGKLVKIIQDYFNSGEFSTGSAFVPPDRVILSVDGADRLEEWSLSQSSLIAPITHAGLAAAPLKQMARDPVDGSLYIVEPSPAQIEKFTPNPNGGYSRAGNPFITATTGACALATPWGITVIPDSQRIAVISSAASGRLSIYDKDGNCVSHNVAAPLNANTPVAIAYHQPSGKFIISFATNHAIYSMDPDGSNATLIFQNSVLVNLPRALATDAQGYIYVSSSGTDTIEKLHYTGTGTATRALAGPLIGPGITSQNPSSVMVIP